jgi:hypothetical protein
MESFKLTPEQPPAIDLQPKPWSARLLALADEATGEVQRSRESGMSFQTLQEASGHLDVAGVVLLQDKVTVWMSEILDAATVG